uniref:peroxisomal ATPase PEX6-like n=1 Tax=Pristiophorus japonicus TaxID=55135 RepID=UPI00398F2AF8
MSACTQPAHALLCPRLLCQDGGAVSGMGARAELRLCRRFPPELHPLQVLVPRAALAALTPGPGPGPSPGSGCVLSLSTGPASGPGLFISATVTEQEPPEEAAGPREQGAGVSGPLEQGAGVTGPLEQGAGVTGPREQGAGVTGPLEQGAGVTGPLEQGAGVTGPLEQGAGVTGPLEQGAGVTGPLEQGAGVSGPREQGAWVSGPREQGAGVSGSREQGAGVTGPREQGAGVTGPREQGAGVSGPREQSVGVSGPREQGARVSGPREQGVGVSGPREQSVGVSGPREQGARVSGPREQGAGVSGPREQGAGVTGPLEQGAGVTGPREQGAGVSGPREQGAGVTGPREQSAGVSGPREQGARVSGPREQGAGVSGPREQGAGVTGPREQGAGVTQSEGPLRIYTSKLFPKHYGLWAEEAEAAPGTGWLRVSLVKSVPTLSKVVLGARSRASLRWASSQNFANGLLILSCQHQQVLLRQGDSPTVPYHPLFGEDSGLVLAHLLELVVLECQPVLQGVLTINTSLVLTDFREANQPQPSELQPLRLLQPLCVSDFAHYAGSLWGAGLGLEPSRPLDCDFMTFLQALECRLEVRVCDLPGLVESGKLRPRAAGLDGGLDPDSCLVLSKQAVQRLGLFNREWVLVSLLEPAAERERERGARPELERPSRNTDPGPRSSPGASTGRLASVVVADAGRGAQVELAENMAAISHALWFNLSNGSGLPTSSRTLKVKRFYQPSNGRRRAKDSRSALCVPPLAKELHVAVIFSPTYSARAVCDGVLFDHFTTQRLVYAGDVVCVRTRGKAEFIEKCTEGSVRWPVLYLKVRSVSGEGESDGVAGFLADTEHTSLYLDGCANSYVPRVRSSECHQFWDSTSPPGLSSIVDTLCNIIQPYLHSGPPVLDGPCGVLLWGPSGSGKTMVVRAACSRLNLHLVKVNCVSLSADSTGASEAKLQAAFSQSDTHRPCVLLLRDVSVFGRERIGVAEDSRLISALHRFIKELTLPPQYGMSPRHIENSDYPVVVLGTVERLQDVFADVQTAFLHEVAMGSLSVEQRKIMLAALSAELPLGKDVNLAKIGKLTAVSIPPTQTPHGHRDPDQGGSGGV